MKQSELIKRMTDKQVKQQLLLSQLFFLLLSIALSVFLFSNLSDWLLYFNFYINQIVFYGLLPAIILVAFELILVLFIPAHHLDDGGINEKVFKNQSIFSIFIIALVVAISEEFLFRGVIQTTFGYVFASSLFVLVHFRYLKKPVLLTLIILTSFLIGYLFKVTENLLVTIVFHFIVDFLLGIAIKYKK